MTTAKDIFDMALEEVKCHFTEYQFMVNRDLAWILQKKMGRLIEEHGLPLEVYHDYPLEKGCCDRKENEWVIVSQGTNYRDIFSLKTCAELVIRVLFEPSKNRSDICEHHLPRILVPQLTHDIETIESLVVNHRSREGICLLIDENSRHRHQIIQTSQIAWSWWGDYEDLGLNVSVLVAHF